jgi:hypothetical protein
MSRVAGMSPADASMKLVEWLMYYQNKVEERLSQDLGVANFREELLGGFLSNRQVAPRDQKRIELFVQIMSLGQQALEVPIGKGSNSAPTLEKLVDQAEALYKDFESL